MGQSPPNNLTAGQHACAVLTKVRALDLSYLKPSIRCNNSRKSTEAAEPTPSSMRRAQSLTETPYNLQEFVENIKNKEANDTKTDTVLYLAYGSNLSAETFRGMRGIKPLSQVNVLVPELELTFNLPGIPYREPCFANSRYRTQPDESSDNTNGAITWSSHDTDYHKDRWKKGLVGVVYEVTKEDFAKIIATEGGGSSYQDILVDAYELPRGSQVVDPHPSSAPFKVHTLYAPTENNPSAAPHRPVYRPDPSYAQPSARYLKLIRDGAAEHDLPNEYQAYLADLRPYTITTTRQKIGATVFIGVWAPMILPLVLWSQSFSDGTGKLPGWWSWLMGLLFSSMWRSYDMVFKKLFGDGERTITHFGRRKSLTDEEHGHSNMEEKKPLLEMME